MPKKTPLRAVFVRCTTCNFAVSVPIRDREIILPLCPKCSTVMLELAGQLAGLISSDGIRLQREVARDNLYLAKTDLFKSFCLLLQRMRPRTAANTYLEGKCIFCEGEPHTPLSPCKCLCHEAVSIRDSILKVAKVQLTGTDG